MLAELIGHTVLHQGGGSQTALILSILIGAFFGSGGVVAFFKARSDIRKSRAETATEVNLTPLNLAQGAVLVQSQVLKDVREELNRQAIAIKVLQERCLVLETSLREVTEERDELKLIVNRPG